MLQKTLMVLCLMAIAIPAGADINVTNGTNPQDITISLDIPEVTKIWWNSPGYSQDGDDQAILFNDIVQNGSNDGDWYRTDLTGAYLAAPVASTDPWATGFYESYDFANFWLESNCNTTMRLLSAGDLSNGSATLPTWYTVALTNNTGSADGFIDGGTRHSDGPIPLDGLGCYAADANTDYTMELFGGAFYPNQYSFPMFDGGGNTTYWGYFTPYAEGTILFHARVQRSGTGDPAGYYTTTLQVRFYQP